MEPKLAEAINRIILQNSDKRTHLFDVQVKESNEKKVILSGEVLDDETLAQATALLKQELSDIILDTRAIKSLRSGKFLWCATNLTSMHGEPSWLAEQLTQCLYGVRFEILKEQGNWVYVRQDDGYIAWVYRPYLSSIKPVNPTHIVSVLQTGLFEKPGQTAVHVSRLFTGTWVAVDRIEGDWSYIAPHADELPNTMTGGWVRTDRLLSINDFPKTEAEKRQAIVDEAFRMKGVPYLWGGCTTNGIDCSGLAQLCHRLAGLNIQRDADQQKNAGRKISSPFEWGDLMFFGDEGNLERITHVGISLGGREIIHSSRSRNGVYIDDIQMVPHLKDTFAGGCSYL